MAMKGVELVVEMVMVRVDVVRELEEAADQRWQRWQGRGRNGGSGNGLIYRYRCGKTRGIFNSNTI